MELNDILHKAYELGGSDIFIVPGAHVTCKVKGNMVPVSDDIVKPAGTEALVREAYQLARRDMSKLEEEGDDDFSSAAPSPPPAAWWPLACPIPNRWASRTW